MITIALGSDHKGFKLKESLKTYLSSQNFKILDVGTNSDKESVDYPDFAHKVIDLLTANTASIGILICDSGIGMSIAANRFKNIRAALCYNIEDAEFARKHNDANILVLAAKRIQFNNAEDITDAFIKTDFEAGRHSKRITKLDL